MLFRFLLFAVGVFSLTYAATMPAGKNRTRRRVHRATGRTGSKQQDPHARDCQRRAAKALGADIKFMQGMIMHHAQAVEMTELLRTRSQDTEVQALGKRISISQTDEMRFMKQWLTDRGLAALRKWLDGHGRNGHAGMDRWTTWIWAPCQ